MYIDTHVHEDELVPPAVALRFLRSHNLPMVRYLTSGEVEAWCECLGPGGDYVERMRFEPDAYGEIDLTKVKSWLGY
jgi:hypothetical protein